MSFLLLSIHGPIPFFLPFISLHPCCPFVSSPYQSVNRRMASSAFKSTTRRTLHSSSHDRPARRDPSPCARSSRSRSRSVSAAPRARSLQEGYANTRTNPLFDCAASQTPSPPPQLPGTATSSGGGDVARRDRGREPLKGGGRGGGRARSVSVAPQRPRIASAASVDSARSVGGRRVSRPPSVADDARSYRGSETDVETRDMTRKLQSRTTQYSVLERCQQMDETTHSVSSTVVSSPGDHLEHAIWQQNHSTVPVDPVLDIPPEFDPDSAEFISDISDYATEYRKEDVVEIPLDFDTYAAELVSDIRHNAAKEHWEQMEIPLGFGPDAAELVSDILHHGTNQQREQMEIPLEFDPDTSELASDITEYTIKLKQSHERARKLRADLAVEEQREQELSRMLNDIVTVPNFTETHEKRRRRKSSIERLKASRHLAEEAMNYFEECVSISTMDSTDFSSPEDPQPNPVVSVPPKSNSRFFHKGRSSFQEPHTPTDQHGHHEESDKQTQCSISITGSDVCDSVILSHTNGLKIRSNSSDILDGFDTPQSRSSCFSFTTEPAKTVENCDVWQYRGNFGRGNNKELRETRPSYFADDYVFQKANADLLMDMVAFQNRIEYGGLLICNIRTF
ncbi:uncharacterized protein LOC133906243 isoform X2 [Phragmites australis]|uniref:uncharacterized protein LOC133906243 isoform X2 n=1 Tax=Phragmites australis TaxID=29695 RepID=UPI002D78CC20|nr:uncharacterized protein LOC133906243 isoform X2 [Phragmites australis]